MFGKIIHFENNKIYLENKKGEADTNYIGYHIVFPETDRKIIGEIININEKEIGIFLIGEIYNNKFYNGVLKKPSISSVPRIIFKSELESILGNQNYLENQNLLFGKSIVYKDYYVTSDLNTFFANHFAIIGNTGSGKSCGISRLLQNIFFTSDNNIPKNAHICLFDVYGEYYNTFDELNKYEGLQFKKYTTQQQFGDSNLLRIPAYLLDVDDLAILLDADDASQLPVLKKALELTKIFTSNSPSAEEYKNDIIAKCLLDILTSGKSSTQIRDQVISILSKYNTPSLNLGSLIKQPGYDRTLKQCLFIDEQGKINAINFVIEFIQRFIKLDFNDNTYEDGQTYTLSDIYYALEFALISEGALTSSKVYDRTNFLRSRLQTIINSELKNFFASENYISKSDYVQEFFKTSKDGSSTQLVDVNLSYINDKFAKCITKILSKMFFEYTTNNEARGSFPIHIILEEAHRYVQNDNDIDVIGYNIFDRITQEGRKYGTILGFITQRPNELSKTALSQCSNFVVFRLFYPDDLNIVKNISANLTDEMIEKVKTLHSGMGLIFGTAFKVPVLVQFDLPSPMPISTSIKIDDLWYK